MASQTFFCAEPYCNAMVAANGSLCSLCDKKHVCNGEMDYERGIKICDDRDDPLCPQHIAENCEACQKDGCHYPKRPSNYATGAHICSGNRICAGWPKQLLCDEPTCSILRCLCCSECGHISEDGFFRTFRGSYPLCEPCAEKVYGPAESR